MKSLGGIYVIIFCLINLLVKLKLKRQMNGWMNERTNGWMD
jgi:hypothetical protein